MKLVICTQYMENYGDAQQPHWKMKGGNIYVVENLSESQLRQALGSEIPTLRSLIEYSNDGSREYVIDFYGLDDDRKVGEDWENPVKLAYEGGKWVAREVTENDEYSFLNKKILRASKSWTMLPRGETADFKVVYTLRDGREVGFDELEAALAA